MWQSTNNKRHNKIRHMYIYLQKYASEQHRWIWLRLIADDSYKLF